MKKVLVVDDNETNVFALATMLRKLGFDVAEASSGMEAVNAVCHESFGLAFVDHLMPNMDGIQTIEKIRFVMRGEECPEFVGVSATIDDDVKAAFEKVEVARLIAKPVKQEVLEKLLDSMGISIEIAESESSDSGGDIRELLGKIGGLDFEKGIELMAGNVENYMKILSVCVKNIDENYVALESIQNTEELERFALYFHSLKGIFLNIGADVMAEKAKTLEFAAKEGNLSKIREQVGGFLADVSKINQELTDASEQYSKDKVANSSGEKISDSEFAGKLQELKQHIEDFEYIEITELLETMIAGGTPEAVEKLKLVDNAIQEFDYEEAEEIVNEMLGSD